MITNEYIQYFLYAIAVYIAYRIVANTVELSRLQKIKGNLINN